MPFFTSLKYRDMLMISDLFFPLFQANTADKQPKWCVDFSVSFSQIVFIDFFSQCTHYVDSVVPSNYTEIKQLIGKHGCTVIPLTLMFSCAPSNSKVQSSQFLLIFFFFLKTLFLICPWPIKATNSSFDKVFSCTVERIYGHFSLWFVNMGLLS